MSGGVRDLPIIFSAPMVRALLGGRKTMHRFPAWQSPGRSGRRAKVRGDWPAGMWPSQWQNRIPGDRLWVKEPWHADRCYNHLAANEIPANAPVFFDQFVDGWHKPRHPGHLPRERSRLTLIVTATKIERLQEISEEDAEAEGIETDIWDQAPVARRYGTDGWFVGWPMGVKDPSVSVDADEVNRRSFATLWDSLHGPGSWDANPECVALTFQVHQQNIDSLARAA